MFRKALSGSRHLQFLVENDLLTLKSLPELEAVYADGIAQTQSLIPGEKRPLGMAEDVDEGHDRLVLRLSDAKKLASILEAPELLLEVERAVLQVTERQQKAREKDE